MSKVSLSDYHFSIIF